MNETEQNRNQFTLDGRVNATLKYTELLLQPQNENREAYFINALITATLIFNGKNNHSVERMVNILNNQLEIPLTKDEQTHSLSILQQGIREGRL